MTRNVAKNPQRYHAPLMTMKTMTAPTAHASAPPMTASQNFAPSFSSMTLPLTSFAHLRPMPAVAGNGTPEWITPRG